MRVTVCLAALCLAPACAQTQRGHGHSSRPSAAPPDVDCAVRKLASAYGPSPALHPVHSSYIHLR